MMGTHAKDNFKNPQYKSEYKPILLFMYYFYFVVCLAIHLLPPVSPYVPVQETSLTGALGY